MLKKVKTFMNNPKCLIPWLGSRGAFNFMSDEQYLKMLWKIDMGYDLNLDSPTTFNEKLQWLKLYDRKPEYTCMVDKYEAKKYVAGLIGEEHIIPTLGVWEHFDDIDFDSLPERFVLKTTHDSGGIVICRDKSSLDMEKTKRTIERSLRRNYFWMGREWPYKNVKPRIIAEEYMEDAGSEVLRDYKYFCFNGVPRVMLVATDRFLPGEQTKFTYFDMNFNKLPFRQGGPSSDKPIEKPASFEEMANIAAKLSQGIAHVRVDLYEINGKVYFGEMTFFDSSGFAAFDPPEWDRILGNWIELPEKKC